MEKNISTQYIVQIRNHQENTQVLIKHTYPSENIISSHSHPLICRNKEEQKLNIQTFSSNHSLIKQIRTCQHNHCIKKQIRTCIFNHCLKEQIFTCSPKHSLKKYILTCSSSHRIKYYTIRKCPMSTQLLLKEVDLHFSA